MSIKCAHNNSVSELQNKIFVKHAYVSYYCTPMQSLHLTLSCNEFIYEYIPGS